MYRPTCKHYVYDTGKYTVTIKRSSAIAVSVKTVLNVAQVFIILALFEVVLHHWNLQASYGVIQKYTHSALY